jgi:hypothetical protein
VVDLHSIEHTQKERGRIVEVTSATKSPTLFRLSKIVLNYSSVLEIRLRYNREISGASRLPLLMRQKFQADHAADKR